MKVRLTHHAEADLEGIGDFIAKDNPKRAASFLEELHAKCMDRTETPEAFPLVPHFETFAVRYRSHGNYLIFYALQGDTISILRLLHGARDYIPLLLPD